MKKKVKIAIFGDSISEGIGKRKANYVKNLQNYLENDYNSVHIDNYAFTGTTIRYMKKLREKWIKGNYDIVIVAYGNVDAMLRPDTAHHPNYFSFLPSRYKENGMLNPRPYYSKRFIKSTIQHLDSWFRWHLNSLLLFLQGATTWVNLNDFSLIYEEVVKECTINSNMLLVSTVHVNDKYFPGTNLMYVKYNAVIEEIAKKYNQKYIDLYDTHFDKTEMFDDGFHPNELGYQHIAKVLYEAIKTPEVNRYML